jgi:tetratricopeptide (TPR) repeat protein
MESTNSRKEIFVLWIYSILILIYAAFDIVTQIPLKILAIPINFFGLLPQTSEQILQILPKFLPISIKPNTAYLNYFFIYTGIALYTTPINIIIGFGLLKRNFWARYGVIATMFTLPVILLTQYLWWGYHSFHLNNVLIQLFFAVLTLFYFSRRSIKSLFDESHSFKFISWHGLLIVIIILISFYGIMISLHWKIYAAWKYGYPSFIDKTPIIALKSYRSFETSDKYRKVALLNASLFVPKEFVIRKLTRQGKKNDKWLVCFKNRGGNAKAFIFFGNDFPYEELLEGYEGNWLRSRSKYNLEKHILTNNWNPGSLVSRSSMSYKREGFHIKEFHINDQRGFLKSWQMEDVFSREFSIYDREGIRYLAGTTISVKEYLDEKDVLTFLSSIEFLKPEGSDQAKNHYEKGLTSYKQGETLQAQVEFTNAYTLSPENPDYIFMLAKSLLSKEMDNYDYVKDLLNDVLKIKPDHKEAKKLLKEIEAKLPKPPKNN